MFELGDLTDKQVQAQTDQTRDIVMDENARRWAESPQDDILFSRHE